LPETLVAALKAYPLRLVLGPSEKGVLPAAAVRAYQHLEGMAREEAYACRDKLTMKARAMAAGLQVTPHFIVEDHAKARELVTRLGLPFVIKPRLQSGSRGLRIVHSLDAANDPSFAGQLAEAFIEGRELSVESFVHGGEILFSNITDYHELRVVNIMPAALDQGLQQEVLDFNARAIRAFRIHHGLTHVEMYVSAKGLVFGEIAARPPGGYLMDLLSLTSHFNPWQAYVALESGQRPTLPHARQGVAASWIIHPGAGRVDAISGWKAIEAAPGVARAHLKLGLDDMITPRLGAGEDEGYVLITAPDHETLLAHLDAVRGLLDIQMKSA